MATENIQAGARVDVTTLNAQIKKTVDSYFARDYVFTELQKRGRFTFNQGGKKIAGKVCYRKATPNPITGYPTDIDFDNINYWKDTEFPWRGWSLGYEISEFEKLAQQSGGSSVQPVALIKLAEELARKASKDFMDYLLPTVFDDGNANSTNLMGFRSWTGNTGSLITSSVFLDPSDQFGGLYTNLGYYDGSWTGTFPNGTGDFSYRFFSPLLLGYLATSGLATTTTGTHTWATQWESAIRHLTGYSQVLQPTPFDALVMDPAMLIEARDSLNDRTRFVASSKPSGVSIGWSEFDFEGLKIVTQYGCPSGEAYGVRFDEMEMRCMHSQLLKKKTDEDISDSTEKVALTSYIQLLFSTPAMFGALLPYPVSGT